MRGAVLQTGGIEAAKEVDKAGKKVHNNKR